MKRWILTNGLWGVLWLIFALYVLAYAHLAPTPDLMGSEGSVFSTNHLLTNQISSFSLATLPDEDILFTNGQNLSTSIQAMALGDVNKDNSLDIFTTPLFNGPNKAWWNDGNGLFTSNGQSLGNANSWAVVLGDIDKDDDLDAFVANYGQADQVWLNDGTGMFTAGQSLNESAWSRAVALGDVNGDDYLDALVGGSGGGRIWLNDGQGTFDNSQALSQSDSWAVALADLDGDDDLDAFIGDVFRYKIWLNNGKGAFYDSGQDVAGSGLDLAMGDVDGDSDVDALMGACCFDPTEVWLNTGKATFINSNQTLGVLSSSNTPVALGDVDGDCDLDALLGTSEGGQVWVNDDEGFFTEDDQSLGSFSSDAVALGDLDGDDDLDALVGAQIWLNQSIQVESRGCLPIIYLPIVLKSPPQTHLYVQSTNTGGGTVEVRDPEAGDALLLTCSLQDNPVAQLCGSFPPVGQYKLIAQTANCGVLEGVFNDADPNATVTREVFCD